MNSLSLRIDIGLANPGSSPVLDISSPASVAYSVSMQIFYSEMHGRAHPKCVAPTNTKEVQASENWCSM